MKAVILALAVGVATATTASAQLPGRATPTTSTSRGTSVDGSWRVVGRDQSGTIYERTTYDAYGNLVVQQARRDANGNFRILSTRTVQNGSRNDCQVGTATTVGGIVLPRSGSNNCTYDNRSNRRTNDGVWRHVGKGKKNNSIYERRTRDAYGNVVIQRARRNPNGSFTILSTRTVRNDRNVSQNNGNRDDRWDNRRGDDDDDDDRWDNRRTDDDSRFSSSEQNGRGKGKGHKGRD